MTGNELRKACLLGFFRNELTEGEFLNVYGVSKEMVTLAQARLEAIIADTGSEALVSERVVQMNMLNDWFLSVSRRLVIGMG